MYIYIYTYIYIHHHVIEHTHHQTCGEQVLHQSVRFHSIHAKVCSAVLRPGRLNDCPPWIDGFTGFINM